MDNIERIRKYLSKYLSAGQLDAIDIKAHYDNGLSYQENKELFHEKFVKNLPKEPTRAVVEANERRERECILALENEYQKIHEQAVKFIKESESTNLLDKAYSTIREFTKAVIRSKKIHGLILESPTGLGKTYNCTKNY